MQELRIDKNDDGQRLDRFLLKYLSEAPRSFIFRMLRKKNIELNNNRARPEDIVYEGDRVQLFLSDETIEKFRGEIVVAHSNMELDIIYEDKNIMIINKPSGILSHDAGTGEDNLVDGMINYLIRGGQYNPEEEHSFIPSIINRLDRNTSGIIIAGKNYEALKDLNESMRQGGIDRYYMTIVRGRLDREMELEDYLIKDGKENKVELSSEELEGGRIIKTRLRPIKYSKGYSLVEVQLLTGRPHQIRAHLSSINLPIIGDRKYGDRELNQKMKKEFGLEDQYLHGYKVEFIEPADSLKYLKSKSFTGESSGSFKKIEEKIFS